MILGIFTELLGPGGVQQVGRHLAAVLASLAEENGWSYLVLSLNDPSGHHISRVGKYSFSFQGFGRHERRFVLALLRAVPGLQIAILGHPNLAPFGLLFRVFKPRALYWVVTYGVEVWSSLPQVRRLGLRLAHQVIAISHFTATQVVTTQGVSPTKVEVVPPALGPDLLSEKASPSLSLPSSHVLLTVARLAASEQYKGIDKVIQALPKVLKHVPNVLYVVVGDGDDRPHLERLAIKIGVHKHVFFMGRVTSNELKAYYKACEVFIMPSRGEGFGIVFLEAMSFGKPVIGGNHGGTPDVIVEGETGFLVEYGDIDALADRLIRLLRDEDLRKRMGEAARRRVEENYTFEHFRKRLVELFTKDGRGTL